MEINRITTPSTDASSGGDLRVAKQAVIGVLNSLFGLTAYKAVFKKGADGIDLVDLTNLPHVDRGWAGGGVVFHTSRGQMSLQDVRQEIMDAQKRAGVSKPIEVTMRLNETPGG